MWREKLQALRARPQNPPLMFVFWVTDPAPAEHLAAIRARAPFVPESYLDFLRLTDGAQFDFFVLYGSGQTQFRSLKEANESWEPVVDLSRSLVIGEDAVGNAFVLDEDGRIRRVSNDPPGRDEVVAESFDALLDSGFMGPRYAKLVGTITDDNIWWSILRENAWV
jgi:hypothetical protein